MAVYNMMQVFVLVDKERMYIGTWASPDQARTFVEVYMTERKWDEFEVINQTVFW